MNRRLSLRAGGLAIVSTFVLVSCSAQLDGGTRHAFFVRSALAPPAAGAGACVFGHDANATTLFEGTVDLGLRDDYQLTLLAQASDGSDATSITGAHVVVRHGDVVLQDSDVVTNGYVDRAGFGVVSLLAVDAVTSSKLLPMLPSRGVVASLVVEISLTGNDPAGGAAVSSPVFRFPVKACSGCLVDFSTGNDPLERKQPNCLKLASASAPPRRPCFLGQDENVSCELCVGKRAACDPTTP